MRNAYLHEAVRNWKAVCGETRKHGLGRDGRKRSARNLAYRLLYKDTLERLGLLEKIRFVGCSLNEVD